MPERLDIIYLKLLIEIQKNPLVTNAVLGRASCISPGAARKRREMLENQLYIVRYEAVLDFNKVGKTIEAQISFKLEGKNMQEYTLFEKKLEAMPEVLSYYRFASFEYSVRVLTTDMDNFRNFMNDNFYKIDDVVNIESLIVTRYWSSQCIDLSDLEGRFRSLSKRKKRR